MSMLAVLDQILTLLSFDIASSVGAIFSTEASGLSFAVDAAKCTPQSCPGSFYTAIATAWANIGYVTHSDVLRFLNTTNFGNWAIILYIGAAITGLLGVATNAPMKNYTWFFIGPALYSFLVGTTMNVQGVNWVVANIAQEDMSQVWRNAEAGLANTRLARDGEITIDGENGPQGQYEVAMPMVFLDELFSATANILIEWTGIGNQVAGGKGTRTNLADNQAVRGEGPWWLLSSLKWGYIENITSATARNPDVRDALVTFLGSECGEKFKEEVINSGAYIAAAQARGSSTVKSVMYGEGRDGYKNVIEELNKISIPTPRSLARLFKNKTNLAPPRNGALYDKHQANYIAPTFLNFSERLPVALEAGRGHGIVCSEYLWTIIQALRFEAGHAYHQLTRNAPKGLKEEQFINTIVYGWDIRKTPDGNIADVREKEAFVMHLILAYIVRNELLFAPQITSVDQRFAPSEQAKSYSDAYVGTYGAKAKFIELYNAAIMMPYLQGILAYFLIVSYPIACMLVILPGHYKGFFTWVSFFAWIKIWDVGFAMVQVIERSVWAMVGNHKHMAATANVLIEAADKAGGIGVTNPVGAGMGNGFGVLRPDILAAQSALPLVCSVAQMTGECADNKAGEYQSIPKAFELFDKLLLTSANIDLDLSNGWYIYIMSALYLAVPAVTGQLVLGAKAGSASMMKDAWSGVANDGSNAAKTGAQHKDVAALTSNSGSLGQAAYAAAMRKADGKKGSLMAQSLMAGNQAMELGMAGSNADKVSESLGKQANVAGTSLSSYDRAAKQARHGFAIAEGGVTALGAAKLKGGGGGGGSGGGAAAALDPAVKAVGSGVDYGFAGGSVQLGQVADRRSVEAAGAAMDLSWQKAAADQSAQGLNGYSKNIGAQAHFEAESAAWEARNQFASHAAAQAGIAGMNAGTIAPGAKPTDSTGMAMSGMTDSFGKGQMDPSSGRFVATASSGAGNVAGQAHYGGEGWQTLVGDNLNRGMANHGSGFVTTDWFNNPAKGAFNSASANALAAEHGPASSSSNTQLNTPNLTDIKSNVQQYRESLGPYQPGKEPLRAPDITKTVKALGEGE